jgi:hypothetical protein
MKPSFPFRRGKRADDLTQYITAVLVKMLECGNIFLGKR